MAVFELHNHNGDCFNRKPQAVKSPRRGWVIQCHAADTTLYGGHYTKIIGHADRIGGVGLPFRLKRDAVRAIAQGEALGLFSSLT